MDGMDRQAVVRRHEVVLREADPRSPLTVGNGEFCFTADLTGLQTFPEHYPVGPRDPGARDATLLGTMSQWGWHSVPPAEPYAIADSMITYESPRGPVRYVDQTGAVKGGTEHGTNNRDLWLRANPHRLHLGRIGFARTDRGPAGEAIGPADLVAAEQRLDAWTGALHSTFRLAGHEVRVITVVDPDRDLVAVRVASPALAAGLLAIRLDFPYGSEDWHSAADWSTPERHRTESEPARDGWTIRRELDDTRYEVRLATSPGSSLRRVGPHTLRLDPGRAGEFELRAWFGPGPTSQDQVPEFADVQRRAAGWWSGYWSSGGVVDLSGTDDPRAAELERRTVLSQYLTALSAGSTPPAETGLICNSWRGKFHLEMHWWHSAHFALWGRPDLLLRSLRWYHDALPVARGIASEQGYRGARWPKQIGPDVREAPSSIGPFLVWQQPHPIFLAELAYRAVADQDPGADRAVLEEFADVVFASADFMADLAVPTDRGYELGPPLIPAQESYGGMRARLWNPTYELVYWHWALDLACRWRERLGRPADPAWREVSDKIIAPVPRAGRYPAIGVDPYTIRTDHPSMLCALGVLPQTTKINSEVMAATLDDVLGDWDWSSTWGWDYPVIAMCAARLGRPETAVDALLADRHKNEVLPNGHNRQTSSLPLYLPGNGGLLAAVALMAAGWTGGPERSAPGFPADWTVRSEGLIPPP
ncbi:hypothetical protein BKA15_002546 [Microlunatus parietis]|uniref:Glycoside hydrolase family 65 n=2 Tax=Microlunatus parietis TaxID=682979 RepID=A0A7Y9I6U3_9ACTN|nr:hypothetical protein [Microlunatus parietis]